MTYAGEQELKAQRQLHTLGCGWHWQGTASCPTERAPRAGGFFIQHTELTQLTCHNCYGLLLGRIATANILISICLVYCKHVTVHVDGRGVDCPRYRAGVLPRMHLSFTTHFANIIPIYVGSMAWEGGVWTVRLIYHRENDAFYARLFLHNICCGYYQWLIWWWEKTQ